MSHDNSTGQQPLTKDGRPTRVLIVEDDAFIAMDIEDMITKFGGTVVGTALEPSRAFQRLLEHKPDVVIMDVRLLGGRDGIQAAYAIRTLHSIPIVFCTGHRDLRTLTKIAEFGAEVLLKPIIPEQLQAALLRATGDRSESKNAS